MIDLSKLRLQQLLGPLMQSTGPTFPMSGMNQIPELPGRNDVPSIGPLMGQQPMTIDTTLGTYQPHNEMANMLANALKEMPEREEPSKWRKFGGALATLQSDDPRLKAQAKDNVLYSGFNRKMDDYKTRIDSLMKGASEEDRRNTNERILAMGNEAASLGRTKAEIAQQQADVKQQMADIAAQKSQQIYETKIKDIERKIDEATKKAELAEAKLAQGDRSQKATSEWRQAQIDAMNERHKLALEQKQRELDEAIRMHQSNEDIKKNPPVKPGSEKVETVTDDKGKVTQKKVTTTGPISDKKPDPLGIRK